MAFLFKGPFPGMEPTLNTRTASIHVETSFALEKKNNVHFSLIWVSTPRIIKNKNLFIITCQSFFSPRELFGSSWMVQSVGGVGNQSRADVTC